MIVEKKSQQIEKIESERIPQMNIGSIKQKRREVIKKIRVNLDKLEILEKQEEDYRKRKQISNLKNQK